MGICVNLFIYTYVFMYISAWVSFHVSTFRFALSISYSVYLCISNPGIYLCIYLFIYPSANLLASYLSTYLAIYLSMCLSFLSPCISIYLSSNRFVHPSIFYLSLFLCTYLSISQGRDSWVHKVWHKHKPQGNHRFRCETYGNHKQSYDFLTKPMKTISKP